MGMLLLDLEFRLERTFKIAIPKTWLSELGLREKGDDVSLLYVHKYILTLCEQQGSLPFPDSWERLLDAVVDATGADKRGLTPDTLLIRDLAPFG